MDGIGFLIELKGVTARTPHAANVSTTFLFFLRLLLLLLLPLLLLRAQVSNEILSRWTKVRDRRKVKRLSVRQKDVVVSYVIWTLGNRATGARIRWARELREVAGTVADTAVDQHEIRDWRRNALAVEVERFFITRIRIPRSLGEKG